MSGIFSLEQLEVILNKFDLGSKEVLLETAFKKEIDLKHQWVDDLEIELRPEGQNIRIKISGLYCQEYACSYKSGGLWQPSSPFKEKFEYETVIKTID